MGPWGMGRGSGTEAMLLGTRLGVEPSVLAQALNRATARCWSSEAYNPFPGVVPAAPASHVCRAFSWRVGGQCVLGPVCYRQTLWHCFK